MNDFLKRQAEDFLAAANGARIPEQFQTLAQDNVAKSRDMFEKLSGVAKDQTKVAEDVMLATQAGAKCFSSKLIENTVANTHAAFDAAQAFAQAKTLPEAGRVQAEFFQRQLQVMSLQTKELFDLSARIAKETFEHANAAAAKSFNQMK